MLYLAIGFCMYLFVCILRVFSGPEGSIFNKLGDSTMSSEDVSEETHFALDPRDIEVFLRFVALF